MSALDRLKALSKEYVGKFDLPGHDPELTDLGNELAQMDAHEKMVNNLIYRAVKIVEEDAKWILDSAAAVTEKREEPRALDTYLSIQFFNSVNN